MADEDVNGVQEQKGPEGDAVNIKEEKGSDGEANGVLEQKGPDGDAVNIKEEKGSDGDANGVEQKLSNLNNRIVRQIEYYFGDINLPKDKFLQEQVKLEDGWIPLEVMLKFKRLSDLTTDCDVIVAALEVSDLVEVSDDKKKIRRNPNYPLPVFNEERRKELMTRTVYCKGFPVDSTTLDKLLNYFHLHGPIENVQMRSYKDKATNEYIFKGSVFVIFKTKELAAKFLKDDIKYEDAELIRKWQSDYIEEKRRERAERKKTTKTPASNIKAVQQRQKEDLPKGAILHLKGINSEITRDNIKNQLLTDGLDVAFVGFNEGDDEAWVRLLGENSSKDYVELLEDGKLAVCGLELDARSLEGDEEIKFLEKTKEEMEKRRQNTARNRKGRKGGRGRGRSCGKSGFLGKRKGSPLRGPAHKLGANEVKSGPGTEETVESD